MELGSYLKRIGFKGPTEPTLESLTSLHLAHMFSVPFENLDIHLGNTIELDFVRLFEKVIGRNRGGFCYEMNGLFGWLLTELGFEIELFSARVYGGDGKLGPEFDHMLLRVNKGYIADVGFGDSFNRPIRFDESEQKQETGTYRITELGKTFQLERDTGMGWTPQYVFTTMARSFDEFEDMCRYQQTSPDSIFTKKIVCSKANAKGRVTYANGRLIETIAGIKEESDVGSEMELKSVLLNRFGFELEKGYEILLHKSELATQ